MSLTNIRLLKFESPTCAVCISMNKRRVVETLKEEFPLLEVIPLVINDAHGLSPDGTPFAEAYAISDALEVQALPTYIITDDRGVVLHKLEGGQPVGAFRKALTEIFKDMEEFNAIGERVMRYAATPK